MSATLCQSGPVELCIVFTFALMEEGGSNGFLKEWHDKMSAKHFKRIVKMCSLILLLKNCLKN
jgi:hypothetical protein